MIGKKKKSFIINLKHTKILASKALRISISSTYYKNTTEVKDLELKGQVETVLVSNHYYGHKRIALALKINKKCIRRIMKKYNLKCLTRKKKYPFKEADFNKKDTKIKNLIKRQCPIKPEVFWVTDFTYIKYKGQYFYLATILDIYTRQVVGINIQRVHTKELVIGALEDALSKYNKPLIVHSDQGSEYDSNAFKNILKQLNIKMSMSKKSSPWENGHQESFYSHFKLELGDVNKYSTFVKLIEAIYLQIYNYNNKRIHSVIKTTPTNKRKMYNKKNNNNNTKNKKLKN